MQKGLSGVGSDQIGPSEKLSQPSKRHWGGKEDLQPRHGLWAKFGCYDVFCYVPEA